MNLSETSNAFNQVYHKASASVVSIHTAKKVTSPAAYVHFFGQEPLEEPMMLKSGLGSGVIMSSDGFILTNFHVISGKNAIKVHLMNGHIFDARVVGVDMKTDLALLKIDSEDLPTLELANSDMLQVGDWAIAIGNPFGLTGSLTVGVVSAKGRSDFSMEGVSDLIQTDVAINPGNSGGALLNIKGELIGINSAVFSKSGEYIGISFSIPINMARRVMSDLQTYGYVRRGWLGVGILPITEKLRSQLNLASIHGAYVGEISESSHAYHAGLRKGDVILVFNDKPIIDYHSLRYRVAETPIGKRVHMTYLREGVEYVISFNLEPPPKKN